MDYLNLGGKVTIRREGGVETLKRRRRGFDEIIRGSCFWRSFPGKRGASDGALPDLSV